MIGEETLRNLPEKWLKVDLEDCVHILDNQRSPINSEEREKRIAGKEKSDLFPYYGATGQVGWIDNYLFDDERVLVGEDGAPFLEPAKNKAYIVRGKVWVNNHAHVLKAKQECLTNSFLLHYLNIFDYRGYVTGTTRYKLTQAQLKKIPIPLPPLDEQQRIVARIEELFTQLDAGVAGLEKVRAQVKRYRQAVLADALCGNLTKEWRAENHLGVELSHTLKDQILRERRQSWELAVTSSSRSILKAKYDEPITSDGDRPPEIPLEWDYLTLCEATTKIADVDHKMPKPSENGIPYISTKDFIDPDGINFDRAKRISREDYEQLCRKVKPEKGDILLSRYGTVGEVRKVGYEDEFQASYSIAIIKTLKKYPLDDYLVMALRSDFVQKQIRRDIRATAQPDLGLEYIRKFVIPLPSEMEQIRILEEVDRRMSITDAIEKSIEQSLRQSARLRQSILQRAFCGKL